MLELRDLVKHYPAVGGESVRAVDGVSLKVEAGEMVALYGPSGSGKTTLLLMVATLLAPTSGTVLIGGRDISSLSEREASHFRLSELGFIRQNFDLLPGVSAIDNAVLKLLKAKRWRDAQREVTPLLERLGLGERLRHRAETLSMGERQRVMIARALSTEPQMLLADEPTGSLDTQRGREVLELLRGLCRERGVAIVLVSHDPMAALYADRVFALRDGKLSTHETTAERVFAQSIAPPDGLIDGLPHGQVDGSGVPGAPPHGQVDGRSGVPGAPLNGQVDGRSDGCDAPPSREVDGLLGGQADGVGGSRPGGLQVEADGGQP